MTRSPPSTSCQDYNTCNTNICHDHLPPLHANSSEYLPTITTKYSSLHRFTRYMCGVLSSRNLSTLYPILSTEREELLCNSPSPRHQVLSQESGEDCPKTTQEQAIMHGQGKIRAATYAPGLSTSSYYFSHMLTCTLHRPKEIS